MGSHTGAHPRPRLYCTVLLMSAKPSPWLSCVVTTLSKPCQNRHEHRESPSTSQFQD